MAITSFGYDGTIGEAQFAQGARHFGSSRYGVAGPADWRVTVAVGTRTVSIAAGTGWGPGVQDTSDAPVTKTLSVAASGQRWDLVVARRNWSTNTTSFEVVEGGSAMTIPGGRNTTEGTLDDQPIAFVRVNTTTSIQEIVDVRVWVGAGGMVARNEAVLQYMDEPGSSVLIDGVRWSRAVNAGYGQEWVKESVLDSGWVNVPISSQNHFLSVPNYALQVRKVGSQVTLRGAVRGEVRTPIPDPENIMAVVPVGFRPPGPTFLGGVFATGTSYSGMLHVDAVGNLRIVYARGVLAQGAGIPMQGTWYVD